MYFPFVIRLVRATDGLCPQTRAALTGLRLAQQFDCPQKSNGDLLFTLITSYCWDLTESLCIWDAVDCCCTPTPASAATGSSEKDSSAIQSPRRVALPHGASCRSLARWKPARDPGKPNRSSAAITNQNIIFFVFQPGSWFHE
jgi:hypothetical protein